MKHLEYELKFELLDQQAPKMSAAIQQLSPKRHYKTTSEDRYFYKPSKSHVLRYRFGEGKSELTYKAIMDGDQAKRKEVNIALTERRQIEDVSTFLTSIGYTPGPVIAKEIEVFDFEDVEICIYLAKTRSKSLLCLEIEAKAFDSVSQAQKSVAKYLDLLALQEKDALDVNNFEYFLSA